LLQIPYHSRKAGDVDGELALLLLLRGACGGCDDFSELFEWSLSAWWWHRVRCGLDDE
jgi:hypothetical protein